MTNENKQFVLNELSENELLIRYRNGNEQAFREVVNRYKKPLYTFLRRIASNPEVIEYIFQETFLQLYSSQDRFDTNRPLKALAILHRRQQSQRRPSKGTLSNRHKRGAFADANDISIGKISNVLLG